MAPYLPSEVSESIPRGALLEFPPASPSFPFQVSTSSNWTTSPFSPVTRSSSRTCGASTGQSTQPSRATTARERRTFSRWGTGRVGRAHSGFTSTPAESNLPPTGNQILAVRQRRAGRRLPSRNQRGLRQHSRSPGRSFRSACAGTQRQGEGLLFQRYWQANDFSVRGTKTTREFITVGEPSIVQNRY